MVDNSGEVLESFDYYPFGLLMPKRNTTGAGTMEKFTGKERDEAIGLDYFGARYYDPALGRWHNVDPLASERAWVSPYNYVQNNPLVRIDPTGLLDWVLNSDNEIYWDENATSQESTKEGETYLGENVIVVEGGSVDENGNVSEEINEATFSLYTPENKEGKTTSVQGNTVSADGGKYATVAEGVYNGLKANYKGNSAVLMNGGGAVPTTKENPNSNSDYHGQKKANEIFIHAGNKNYERLTTNEGRPISAGCLTVCNGNRGAYLKFIEKVPDEVTVVLNRKR